MKAELLLASQAKLGLDGLTPGDGDLAFGLDFLVAGAAKNELPYVSANLAGPDGTLAFPATRVVERAGLKIGLTGLIGEEFALPDARILPVDAAATAAVAALKAQGVDLIVVLSHLGLTGDKALAEAVPGIDAIFGGHDRRHQESPAIVGQTAIFQSGSRAKYVGQATFELVPGATGWADPKGREDALRQRERTASQVTRYEQQLAEATDDATRQRLQRVLTFARKRLEDIAVPDEVSGPANRIDATKIPMGGTLADEPGMKALVDATLEVMGPEIGGDAHGHKGDDHQKMPPPAGPFVTGRACRGCHPAQYKDWAETGHARAYATLMKEKRHFDQDCWSCHVTGAGQPGGPQTPTEAGPLRNVQCEACHGPGQEHMANPVQGNVVRAPAEATCRVCHSDAQTEGRFLYDEYLPKIDHRP